ncbi:MAG: hypothetical protein V4492_01075 [Chlamydiota bacterium]
MNIAIAQRLNPFSHQLGKTFLLPSSHWKVAVYPTRLSFAEIGGERRQFYIDFSLRGPLAGFTAELNLEDGILSIWGTSPDGFVRYCVCAKKDGIWIQVEKAPGQKLICTHSLSLAQFQLAQREHLLIPQTAPFCPLETVHESLSLGNHKKQDWDEVRKRLDLIEIFPTWLRLGQMTPHTLCAEKEGMYALLETCRSLVAEKRKPEIAPAFQSLFLAAFEGVCVPRTFDHEYQGITFPWGDLTTPALPLLTESAALIRSLFFCEHAGVVELLPCILPEFHCGRFVNAKTEGGSLIHFEWTKKFLRTAEIHSPKGDKFIVRLPKEIARFRLQRKTAERQKSVIEPAKIDARGSCYVSLQPGDTLYLDRFES